MKQNIYTILLLSIPALCGAIIALVNSERANEITEKIEAWMRRRREIVSQKKGFFSRWIVRPPLSVIVKLCDWTDSLAHRGVKNGIRTAATLYVVAFWILLVIYAFTLLVGCVIAVLVLILALWIMGQMLGGKSSSTEDAPARSSPRGSGIFSFATECRHCGSKDHASDDCPHDKGFLGLGAETKCRHCGSKRHASDDCPHDKGFVGLGAETECRHCGSKSHASDDCPHDKGLLGLGAETKCRHCGSKEHPSDNCPH